MISPSYSIVSADPWVACWTLGRFNPLNILKSRQAPKRGTLSHFSYWNLLHPWTPPATPWTPPATPWTPPKQPWTPWTCLHPRSFWFFRVCSPETTVEPPGPPLNYPRPPGPPCLPSNPAFAECWTWPPYFGLREARSGAACFHVVHILFRNLLDSHAPTLPPLLNSFC